MDKANETFGKAIEYWTKDGRLASVLESYNEGWLIRVLAPADTCGIEWTVVEEVAVEDNGQRGLGDPRNLAWVDMMGVALEMAGPHANTAFPSRSKLYWID